MKIKLLNPLALTAVIAAVMVAGSAYATRTPEARLDVLQIFSQRIALDLSATTNTDKRYYVRPPFKAYLTGMACFNESGSNIQGNSPTVVTPKINTISVTALAQTFASGTAPAATTLSATVPTASASKVSPSDVIELKVTGNSTNGGQGSCYLSFTPYNY